MEDGFDRIIHRMRRDLDDKPRYMDDIRVGIDDLRIISAEVERLQAENARLKTAHVCEVCADLRWDGCECCHHGIRYLGPDGLLT